MHCYIGPDLLTHMQATSAEIDHKIHQSVYFLPLTIQLALNFNLKQEIQQIYYINSLVNNSNPKEWHCQQGLILLGLP